MTYTEIIAEMVRELGESGAEGDELTSLQADLLSFITSALRRFPLRARYLALTANTGLSVAANAVEVSLPSAFVALNAEPYYISSGARVRLSRSASIDAFNEAANTSTTGTISEYIIQGKKLKFNCMSDESRTLYIDYSYSISGISTGDTFAGTDEMAEVLKDGAKAYYLEAYSEDKSAAAEKMALFRDGLDSLDAQYISEGIGDHVEEAI